ncbi:MAG: hypothetical protein Athens071425_324 [Parcubacteria group bacterium Athens0714_25]|nr:MAG: hypothetical protein Athens071425_324 [Parcubacteria group bacterium Athens0714_25]
MKKRISIIWWSLAVFISSLLLHNIIYAFFGAEDFFFFTLALVSVAFFIFVVSANFVYFLFQLIQKWACCCAIGKNNPIVKNNIAPRHSNSKLGFGEKASDRITAVIGSWKFIIIQSIIFGIWVVLNVVAWMNHWDPYPFILLNLALSFQAAYAAPIIMMSQNRDAERDRKKWEMDLATDKKAEREICAISKKLEQLDREKIGRILEILEKR